MKKGIILLSLFLLGSCFSTAGYAACNIEDIGACKADIGIGLDNNLRDRMVPDNLNKLVRPNSTLDMRDQLLQPQQVPSNINTESRNAEPASGYDANCQFGSCLNSAPENAEINR